MESAITPDQLNSAHLEEYWMIYVVCPATGEHLKVWDCKELSLFASGSGRHLPVTRLPIAVAALDNATLRPLLARIEALDPFGRRRLCVDPDMPLP